MEIQAKEISK